ncbi:CcoQ/FixQ family Cbb3-type cytochrome c oxidase assembly chaperone [Flaviaesturariibacter flavus]|uniref:CcoQ/FixQ family Cbb3-type cytochrome c oxidase assembly chaperone n=1 Tax=Flaviaesturariibacter flavus TaxID=2502780 RepID=A0A4R1B963_9BACT|nr:CcoQ/FixQ family Cbb3-type cytochrome c oxidase assembly chaperone [Flaviaesturariibacter flavus]TCJ13233.1 CcoQ/FixQ family Cbb3-type cytochrome c oxidase assembly chaperone [Flaviaesturariibacter flavus]
MLKFIKQYAETIQGIDIYPVISMVLFFAVFVGMLWFVKIMTRDHAKELAAQPFEDGTL